MFPVREKTFFVVGRLERQVGGRDEFDDMADIALSPGMVCLLFGVGQIKRCSGITEAFRFQSFRVSVFPIGCERKRPRGVSPAISADHVLSVVVAELLLWVRPTGLLPRSRQNCAYCAERKPCASVLTLK